MLVVIAIIAILAAILFPVFAKAREQARKAACASNMKQLALGCLMYASDYDDCLPLTYALNWASPDWTHPSAWGFGMPIWSDLIYPYVKNYGVFVCPSHSSEYLGKDLWARPAWPALKPITYAINDLLMGFYYVDGGAAYAMATIALPAESLLITEVAGTGANSMSHEYIHWLSNVQHFHGPKVNWAFCDGHVKVLKPSQTISPSFLWNLRDVKVLAEYWTFAYDYRDEAGLQAYWMPKIATFNSTYGEDL